MEVFFFTETAYPYLPPESDYESIRVTLPNRHYDPQKGHDLYHRFIDEWCICDEEGLNIMVNEHHQTATCVDPAAPLMLSILARNTKRARLLILGNPVANRNQPVRVAEEMAMIDVLSRGRLECGFVRGVPYEISAGNSNPVRMNERMWEATDLIIKAFTSHDGPFSFEGRFYHHRAVNIWPRPYQQPHPPIWVSTLSPGGARDIGLRGHKMGTFLSGVELTPKIFGAYRQAWAESGGASPMPLDRLGYTCLMYTGDTEEKARAGGEHLLWYLNHDKIPDPIRLPPGYTSPAATVEALRRGLQPSKYELDDLVARGIMFCGTPDTVFNQIRDFYGKVGGFGNLITMGQAGWLNHEDTASSIRLFAREVLPRLKELVQNDAENLVTA